MLVYWCEVLAHKSPQDQNGPVVCNIYYVVLMKYLIVSQVRYGILRWKWLATVEQPRTLAAPTITCYKTANV